MKASRDDSEFITSLRISDSLRSIIARSAREFEDAGDWVSFDTLAYEAAIDDRSIDLNEVFRIPQVIGGPWTPEKVDLSGLGLVMAGTAPHTAAQMARLAGICGKRKLELRDSASIGREILVSEYSFSESDAERSRTLVRMLPGVTGGGSLNDDWNLQIARTALDYRAVSDVESLRTVLEQQAKERATVSTKAAPGAQEFAKYGTFADELKLDDPISLSDGNETIVFNEISPRPAAESFHEVIWDAAKCQWSNGHRHEAVLAAAKAVNSLLQSKVDRYDLSEVNLVRQCFSDKPPVLGKPRLRFLAIPDDQTRNSMRQGAMDFGAGCFAAIRNPLGHRPNNEIELDEQTALERLAALSLLARWIDESSVEIA